MTVRDRSDDRATPRHPQRPARPSREGRSRAWPLHEDPRPAGWGRLDRAAIGARAVVLLFAAFVLLAAPTGAAGQGAGAPAGSEERAPDVPQETGTLEVEVVERDSGRTLAGTVVRLRGRDRQAATDPAGRVVFAELPARGYVVEVTRLGYMPAEAEVEVSAGEVTRLRIELVPSPIHLAGMVVTATGRERGLRDVYQPTTSLTGTELHRNLANSVPATLRNVPGVHVEYNGPGAARPTIRGMGGDRVLMLEDGHGTGDLYQTASDHGVMVEALTADRIEVVRGPAGLLYGPNALGGVVNVIRNDVPRSRPSITTGSISSQFESGNSGVAAAAVLSGPVGPLAYRVEASARTADDTRTPLGELPKTGIDALSGAFGLSWAGDWGFVGVAGRHLDNTYGVPGEFRGELIPGGHPGGVEAEAARTSARIRGVHNRLPIGFFESVEIDGHITRYEHDEIEGVIAGQRIVGTRFDQTTIGVKLTAHHDHSLHDHPDGVLRAEGAMGVSFDHRDLWAGGTQPGTRSAEEWSLSAFGFEELSRGGIRLQVGGRLDHRSMTPARLDSIVVRTDQRRVSKPVEARSFTSVSASLALLRDLGDDWTLGASLARTVRTPSVEELFSDGPHLADFSFDIGSPDLDPETGLGFDLFVRGTRPDLAVEAAVYYNRVANAISYSQTGETVRIFREGVPPRVTPVYEARGDDADYLGFEARVQWEAISSFVLDASAAYTRATRRAGSDPLPFIPPLAGRAELRYEGEVFFASIGGDWALAQRRVPGEVPIGDTFERPQEPTDGYALLGAGLGARFAAGGLTHTLSLEGANLTDRQWRDHLSRIKDIAPQPGRNLQLTYRAHF